MKHQTPQKNSKTVEAFLATISFDPNVWFISISVAQDISSEELLRIIRSQLPEKLEKQSLHTQLKYQLRKIVKYVHNITRQVQAEAKKSDFDSFVTFMFKEDELGRATRNNTESLLQYRSFTIKKVNVTQLSVSHIPDLTHVFQQNKSALHESNLGESDTITVTIDPEHIICYSGKKVSVEKVIWKTKNIYSKPEEDRYLEQVNMSSQNQIIHGTGSEKAKRTYQNGLLLFVKNALEKIQKQFNPQTLYLFLSQSYEPLIKEISGYLDNTIATKQTHLKFISSDQFLDLDAHFLKQSTDTIKESSKIKNNKSTTTNLHEICKLIRQGNIDTLYLSPNLNQSGYITPNTDCYTYPVKNSKKVRSIRPWLIKSALGISTQIVISDTHNMNSEALAIPRY